MTDRLQDPEPYEWMDVAFLTFGALVAVACLAMIVLGAAVGGAVGSIGVSIGLLSLLLVLALELLVGRRMWLSRRGSVHPAPRARRWRR